MSWIPVGVTVSIGVAICPDDASEPTPLIRLADDMLYRAKRAGKNRVRLVAGSEGAPVVSPGCAPEM